MNYIILLSHLFATIRLTETSIKDKPMTYDSGNGNEISKHTAIGCSTSLFGQNVSNIPYSRQITTKLVLNYEKFDFGTFNILNIDNFTDYLNYSVHEKYLKFRYITLSKIMGHFTENYTSFNACKIKDSNWILIGPSHHLFNSNIATYYNLNCNNILCMFNLYFRLINGFCSFAIVHKRAEIKSLFDWSGTVFIGRDTKIGCGVCLEDGVIISNECYIGDYTSIGRYTMVGSNSSIFPSIYVGEKNMIGNYVRIYRNVHLISDKYTHTQQKIDNQCIPHTHYQDLLNLGDSNIFFCGIAWKVRSNPVSYWIIMDRTRR